MPSPSPLPNVNETTYGAIVDSYATKFNIPIPTFRDIVRNASGFDPLHAGVASGTGGIGDNGIEDIGASLDKLGSTVKSLYDQSTDWTKVIGQMNSTIPLSAETVGKDAPANSASSTDGKYIWQYTAEDFKSMFSRYTYGMLIGLAGALLILASLYVLIKNSGDK